MTDNELIAEFMGFSQGKSEIGNTWEHPDKMGIYGGVGQKFKYDVSWDWLMPVVEKIESLGCIVEIWKSLGAGCRIQKLIPYQPTIRVTAESNSMIEAVYQSIIQFIKWYKENKKS